MSDQACCGSRVSLSEPADQAACDRDRREKSQQSSPAFLVIGGGQKGFPESERQFGGRGHWHQAATVGLPKRRLGKVLGPKHPPASDCAVIPAVSADSWHRAAAHRRDTLPAWRDAGYHVRQIFPYPESRVAGCPTRSLFSREKWIEDGNDGIGRGGRLRAYQHQFVECFFGCLLARSQPMAYTIDLDAPVKPCFGDVAQLGEHRLCKPGVDGSSPFVSTL
jgi:hypothetical protein